MNRHLNPKDAALILVDIQNDFCHEEGACAKSGRDVTGAQAIIPNVQALIDQARELQVPVIFIQMANDQSTLSDSWLNRPRPEGYANPADVCKKGTWGTEFYGISPQEGDIIVEKHRYSAFIGTDLDLILRTLGCKSIIVTGVATNVCVESTVRDGFMLDYNVTVVKDAVAGYIEELHYATFANVENTFGLALETTEILEEWTKELKTV